MDSRFIRRYWSATRRTISKPTVWGFILLLGYFGQEAVDKYVFDGKPMNEVWPWFWDTLLAFPQKPLVQLLMIPLAVWLFHRGVMQVIKAENDTQARETNLRREAMRPLAEMLRLNRLARNLRDLVVSAKYARRSVDQFQGELEKWKNEGGVPIGPDNSDMLLSLGRRAAADIESLQLNGLAGWKFHFRTPAIVDKPELGGPAPLAVNQHYFADHDLNVRDMMVQLDEIEDKLRVERSRLEREGLNLEATL